MVNNDLNNFRFPAAIDVDPVHGWYDAIRRQTDVEHKTMMEPAERCVAWLCLVVENRQKEEANDDKIHITPDLKQRPFIQH